jgi:hypothetical protein
MRHIFGFIILLCNYSCLNAQKLDWAGIIQGITNFSTGYGTLCTAADKYGATYVGGSFIDSFNLQIVSGTSSNLSTNHPNGSAYLAKYDSNGVLQFVKTFTTVGTRTSVLDVDATIDGFVICGEYRGIATYDSNGVSRTLPGYPWSTGGGWAPAAFIANYTPTGHLKWIKHFKPEQTGSWIRNFQLKLNPINMKIACLIDYLDSINFLGVTYDIAAKKGHHQLLVQIDTFGSVISTCLLKQVGKYYYYLSNQLLWCGKDELYITGKYTDTLQLISAGSTRTLVNTKKNAKCYVARLDSSMHIKLLHTFGETNLIDSSVGNVIHGLTVDTVTFSYTLLVGFSSLDFTFDDSNTNYTLNPRYPNEAVLVRYDSSGRVQWLKHLFANRYGIGNQSIASTFLIRANNNDLIIHASLDRRCDLDPSDGVQLSNNSITTGQNSIIIRYSDTGRLIWHQSLANTCVGWPQSINEDLNNNIYFTTQIEKITGYPSQLDVDMSSTITNNKSIHPTKINLLIEKLKPCINEQGQLPIQSCAPFLLPSGQQIFNSGNYPFSSIDSAGCLTDYSYIVDIIQTDTGVIQNGAQLQTTNNNAVNQYQWINCATNSPIIGATTNTFEATQNGSYALGVNNGTCIDTSTCYTVTNVALINSLLPSFKLSKIGSNRFLINRPLDKDNLKCYDALGRAISFTSFTNNYATEITVLSIYGMVIIKSGSSTAKAFVH